MMATRRDMIRACLIGVLLWLSGVIAILVPQVGDWGRLGLALIFIGGLLGFTWLYLRTMDGQ